MDVILREFREEDLPSMTEIWNIVIEEGNAFPQMDMLTKENAKTFFKSQSFSGVAVDGTEVVGLYILHPNNVGRCGHIANASYAVKKCVRGCNIGEKLVRDSIKKGLALGFRILQFNAVVSTNHAAIHLYEKIGFKRLGVVPGGYLLGDGSYTDIILYYIKL